MNATASTTLDTSAWRDDFPALQQTINGQPLTYLDSAASAQAPQSVIDVVKAYQRHDHANVHRGVHTLSHRATDAYEGARDKLAAFIGHLWAYWAQCCGSGEAGVRVILLRLDDIHWSMLLYAM